MLFSKIRIQNIEKVIPFYIPEELFGFLSILDDQVKNKFHVRSLGLHP